MALLSLQNASIEFGGDPVLDGVTLNIEEGERVCILGANGAGKSTLLKILAGVVEPDSGEVIRAARVRLAYLPQEVPPDRDGTAYDVVAEGEEDEDGALPVRVEGVLKRQGLDPAAPFRSLSGGNRRRVLLAKALLREPDVLMLDEPTNHLDLISREWMEDALSDYGEALLFVSHDRWFIEKFATRIWYLHNGRIEDFKGGFAAWREFEKRRESLEQTKKAAAREKAPRRRTEPNRDRQRSRVEREIEKAEAAIAALEAEMAESAADYVKLMELEQKKAEADTALEELYIRWEELSD
jgi:ATP-binding cassette subfamily F protein uup